MAGAEIIDRSLEADILVGTQDIQRCTVSSFSSR